MDVIFANPAAAWALLGIPAVLLVHFLQSRTRRVESSTLFLLERVARESEQGRVFERLRSSPVLWLQLLAVLLAAWCLARPLWIRANSVQPIAIVLDSSVSMQPFQEPLARALRETVRRLERTARRCVWTVLDSDAARARVFAGSEADAMLRAVAAWRPRAGHHDPGPALSAARAVAGPQGIVLFVTDREPTGLPPNVEWIAVGQPIENCGFAGARVAIESNEAVWRAIAVNYGAQPARRTYRLLADGLASEPQAIELKPGAAVSLRGVLPAGWRRARLALEADRFPLDDELPLVAPGSKRLTADFHVPSDLAPLVAKLAESVEGLTRDASGRPDLSFTTFEHATSHAIVFLHDRIPAPGLLQGPVVAERHPLIAGLTWNGLIARAASSFAITNTDEVLVWQGDRPLIALRDSAGRRQLLFNFDVHRSNAARWPAFALLVHRFVESVRDEKAAYHRRNVELNQRLNLAADPAGGPCELVIEGQTVARGTPGPDGFVSFAAPDRPTHFSVRQVRKTLLDSASHFADAREADFRAAVSKAEFGDAARQAARRNSRDDFLAPLWIVLLGGALLGSWYAGRPRSWEGGG